MTAVTIVHVSDLHFGGVANLEVVEQFQSYVPTLGAAAIVISGDVAQRARHGEFQAARALVRRLAETAPTLLVPGNHDVQWWRSPLGLLGKRPIYGKFRQYFGETLAPVLHLPGAIIAGAVSAHGLALGSLTLNPNDLTVKGHLPRAETIRLRTIFDAAPPGHARVAVVHHNVLRGELSRRMGLSHWRSAQRRLRETGADLVLCGHDHQDGAGQIGGVLAVSTANTLSNRSREARPCSFNVVRVDDERIQVEHHRWRSEAREFQRSDLSAFARQRPARAPAGSQVHA